MKYYGYEKIGQIASKSEVNGIDETPWKQNGVLHYLWAMVNKEVAFFKIHKNRSKQAFLALIEDYVLVNHILDSL